jgi:hypothetical protein
LASGRLDVAVDDEAGIAEGTAQGRSFKTEQ